MGRINIKHVLWCEASNMIVSFFRCWSSFTSLSASLNLGSSPARPWVEPSQTAWPSGTLARSLRSWPTWKWASVCSSRWERQAGYFIFSHNVSNGRTRRWQHLHIFRAYLGSYKIILHLYLHRDVSMVNQTWMITTPCHCLLRISTWPWGENNLRESFRLLACFKKDMHKVETYLRVANCRRSLDSNCTL